MAFMKKLGRPDLVAHADYIACVDNNTCIHCGTCAERCLFGAQEMQDGQAVFNKDRCYGCGLCVTTCPSNSIHMALRT